MAERQVKRWVTVNGHHVPIYEDSDDWMSSDMKARYSMFIDKPELYSRLDSDEKTWVEALRAERQEKEQTQKELQIKANAEEAKRLNEQDKEQKIKPWSKGEDKRTKEMSKFVMDHLKAGEDFGEFYEENVIEEYEPTVLKYEGYKDDEISVSKMNLIYTQNYDENEMRVKRGKAVTGSTYYVVQTDNGSIDETNFAYKTKADADHAKELYIQELNKYRKRTGN